MFSWFKKTKKEPQKEVVSATKDFQEDFENVARVCDYFKELTGVTFEKQQSILRSKLISFCRQRDIYSFSTLIEKVDYEPQLRQELIDYLTTNETYFYREFEQIRELVSLVKSSSHSVRILCAPCATGEEPYSIAIALLEAGVSPTRFSILGIDINSDAIEKAKVALYKERNIRNLSADILSRYFTKIDDKFSLHTEIKERVAFRVVNIFAPEFRELEKFDYIFSRNMLIYFDAPTKKRAQEILKERLKGSDEQLFFGHADLY